jgi:peptide subunit release factor 1 (eRF1)
MRQSHGIRVFGEERVIQILDAHGIDTLAMAVECAPALLKTPVASKP